MRFDSSRSFTVIDFSTDGKHLCVCGFLLLINCSLSSRPILSSFCIVQFQHQPSHFNLTPEIIVKLCQSWYNSWLLSRWVIENAHQCFLDCSGVVYRVTFSLRPIRVCHVFVFLQNRCACLSKLQIAELKRSAELEVTDNSFHTSATVNYMYGGGGLECWQIYNSHSEYTTVTCL